nr:Down syndrome cell adhesion molecule-like protein Dscam2 [Penaeus vannamei]
MREEVPSAAPTALRCAPMTPQRPSVMDPLAPALAPSELSGETTNSVSVALRGLRPHTNYSLQVVAFTRVGDGPASDPVFCSTEEDVPGPPAGVKAAISGRGTMVVSWLPPTNSNGRLLTYTVTTRGRDVKRHSANVSVHPRNVNFTTFHRPSVSPHPEGRRARPLHQTRGGASFELRQHPGVRGCKHSGRRGTPSPPVTIALSTTVPARVVSWGGVTGVHWEEDVSLRCEAVGIPPPGRTWYRDNIIINDATNKRVSSYPDGTLVLRDVQRKDSGNYTCRVTNTHGEDHITYVLSVQVPPQPPQIHVTRTGATTLTVAWRTGDSGGAPLLGLTISYKRDYGEWQEETVGDGRPSENLRTKTAGSPPLTGGREAWSSPTPLSETVDGSRPVELGGLNPSTAYVVSVTAHNSAGSTVQEYPFTTAALNGGMTVKENKAVFFVFSFILIVFYRFEFIMTFFSRSRHGRRLLDGCTCLAPVVASSLALLATVITVCVCVRRRPPPPSPQSGGDTCSVTAQENKENLKQREQYYATVRKTSPHRDPGAHERVPEYADDIYPYATFR